MCSIYYSLPGASSFELCALVGASLCSTPPLGYGSVLFKSPRSNPPPPRGSIGLPESPKVQAPPPGGSAGHSEKSKVQHLPPPRPPTPTPRCEVKSRLSARLRQSTRAPAWSSAGLPRSRLGRPIKTDRRGEGDGDQLIGSATEAAAMATAGWARAAAARVTAGSARAASARRGRCGLGDGGGVDGDGGLGEGGGTARVTAGWAIAASEMATATRRAGRGRRQRG